MNLKPLNIFINNVPADDINGNYVRQVEDACFSFVKPTPPTKPQLIHCSIELATLMGLSIEDTQSDFFLKIFSGSLVLDNTRAFALCYGGHQFGFWAGQLGDGRAINLFEIESNNTKWTLQLKGAGKTPFSRNADGLAVLRSSIREHLCSEAMHHLGVPSTRSLALFLSGDQVLRDVLYDGNPAFEKGAIVCRAAASFIRFGSFEILAARGKIQHLKTLADYVVNTYFLNIKTQSADKYVQFFEAVAESTLAMILHWQRVGFVHGVMNTDNMSIHGLTIDYGPYGWLEDFNNGWTPNTTDRQHKRYRFGNQANIAFWNLCQLANAILPLVNERKPFEDILFNWNVKFKQQYLSMMCSKIGIAEPSIEDEKLVLDMESLLQAKETDMTIFFRQLGCIKTNDSDAAAMKNIEVAFYNSSQIKLSITDEWEAWFGKYLSRLRGQKNIDDAARQNAMNAINPKYVLRNYMAQLAIDAAEKGDYLILEEIYKVLKTPYAEQPNCEKWYAKRPEWARTKVGCSMLSCSS